ncbi:MAG: YdeI/OmpD-associated family protein [Alphaproteobacteria bacterium]|nr:YdeI/OmpD-associated family protein [Alphaproteobacteria bacterium]MBU1515597.1 YdeI/OmpD-associated family protein [Alphaproteobacteria bacterium]MBU2096932.1 YdeI/OmpD-associated family protein [Alphaproteobacteria bacterium]MBU2149587.1 YdeI/OmpD-associated family protein [Alphaproteobacteria bacterium]MBU2305677.1 YdeI/OmpD-associated family protein [Alphaproteobacteria bacterium]
MSGPTFFATPAEWRAWLAANHATATELSVGLWKTNSGKPSITWPQSVDEALSFGWIDGVRHRIDDAAYRIRFTPRKPGGIWSQVNVKRFAELKAEERITPAGQAAYDIGKDRTNVYSYEREADDLTPAETARFQANGPAWTRFQAFPPGYRKVAVHRVTSAKGEATRARRLDILIDASAQGLRLGSPTQIDPTFKPKG